MPTREQVEAVVSELAGLNVDEVLKKLDAGCVLFFDCSDYGDATGPWRIGTPEYIDHLRAQGRRVFAWEF